MSDATPDLIKNSVALSDSPGVPPSSQLQTIEVLYRTHSDVHSFTLIHTCLWLCQVTMELVKESGRTLGFSIAGGRGSTPAYEDVDEVLHDSNARVTC